MSVFHVESKFGKGSQHEVGKLKDGLLVKWPYWKGKLWDKSSYETAKKDSSLLKEMGIPVPEVEVVESPTIMCGSSTIKPPYAILIEEVRGRIFRELDLSDENVKEQIIEVVRKSVSLRAKSNVAVDFLGGEAISQFVQYLFREKRVGQLGAYNLLIQEGNQLKLIDTNLLNPGRAPFGRAWLINTSIDLQHTLLSALLQNRDLIDACLHDNQSGVVTNGARKLYKMSRSIEAKRIREDLK